MAALMSGASSKIIEKELAQKCKYAAELFPIAKNVCSVAPAKMYTDIYQRSWATDLWKFQQDQCLPHATLSKIFAFSFAALVVVRTFSSR
jgi:hypothetical protein